jgi:hypothetical protein
MPQRQGWGIGGNPAEAARQGAISHPGEPDPHQGVTHGEGYAKHRPVAAYFHQRQ